LGIGSLHEMGHPGLSSLEDARTWERGSWPIEVLVWWAELDPVVSQENGLRPGGDLFLDGSIGSRTAAVSFGYRGDGGNGTLFHDDQEVAAFFSDCTASGRAAGVHAIGDRAIEQAVVALETAATRHGLDAVRRCRHRIEHVELPRDDHIARLAALGVVASVQPVFDALWGGEGQLYEERFGANVALASNPFGRLHGAGIPLAFGSDSTVTPLDPWGAVHAAEHHRGGFGVDRSTALEAHVNGGRLAAGQPRGVLRAGEPADLTVWDRDPLTVADPRSLRCLATLVGGRSAHGDLVVA
jgi:predicted amidohydrolase YtcJ